MEPEQRIIEGNCLVEVPKLTERPNMILADPPFNLAKDFGAEIQDDLPECEYEGWLWRFYRACWAQAGVHSVLYGHCSPDQIPLARLCIETAGWTYVQTLLWWGRNGMKRRAGRHRIWATLYEAIIYAIKGDGLRAARIMPWYHGIIEVPRPQSNHPGGRWHVCEKPVRLYELLLEAHEGVDLVLDPAVGSGSSLVACAELGIPAIGIELNPETARLARGRVRAARKRMSYAQARLGAVGLFG